jgi:hypothetical protein
MPVFYFHTDDGRPEPDKDGTELPHHVAAQAEATRILGQLLEERPEVVWREGSLQVTVTDEAGLILGILQVSAVISPASAGRPPLGAGR